MKKMLVTVAVAMIVASFAGFAFAGQIGGLGDIGTAGLYGTQGNLDLARIGIDCATTDTINNISQRAGLELVASCSDALKDILGRDKRGDQIYIDITTETTARRRRMDDINSIQGGLVISEKPYYEPRVLDKKALNSINGYYTDFKLDGKSLNVDSVAKVQKKRFAEVMCKDDRLNDYSYYPTTEAKALYSIPVQKKKFALEINICTGNDSCRPA